MEPGEDVCCCCRCCENLSAATDTTCLEHQYPLQPNQEHLEIFQWIGLETAELLPAYITRYYNNLHHQLQRADETLMLLLLLMMMIIIMMQKRMKLMLMMTPALTLAMIGLTTTWRRHCAINYEYLHARHVVR
ncbi:GM23692 [Drosophila sechellia]|uniref:GM23692 n=1 Tax=Drosophila sechellia TaxID=7238 RepID=B4HM47_DROSE|nr:GM23692 [Drosophila sechellia]